MSLPQYSLNEYDLYLTQMSGDSGQDQAIRVVIDPEEHGKKRFTAGTLTFDREGRMHKTEVQPPTPVHIFEFSVQPWTILAKHIAPGPLMLKESRSVEIPRSELAGVTAIAAEPEELRPRPTSDWNERIDPIKLSYRYDGSGKLETHPVLIVTGTMGNPVRKVVAVNNPLHRRWTGKARILHLSGELSWYLHPDEGCPVAWYMQTRMEGELGPHAFTSRAATVATPRALGKRR